MSPISPARMISTILRTGEEYKKVWPTIKTRFLRLAISMSSSHSAEEEAIGFTVPDWLREEAARIRTQVTDSGVHVVGDLDELTPLDVLGADPGSVSAEAQLDAALTALDRTVRQAKRIRSG